MERIGYTHTVKEVGRFAMKKFGMLTLIILFITAVSGCMPETQNRNESMENHIFEKFSDNIQAGIIWEMEQQDGYVRVSTGSMPKIIDVIIEDNVCTALCEDGSVWVWENIYERNNLHKISDDGQVFISEYVTNGIKDMEYYILGNTNPNRVRTKWVKNMQLKTIDFHMLDWQDIVSINTNEEFYFSAVDAQGEYYYLDMTP